MSRSATFFWKPPTTKRNTPKSGSSACRARAARTAENLLDAAAGEHYEWSDMYASFAQVAKEEGFNDIAALFDLVAKIENSHEQRFRKLLDNLNTGKVFQRDAETVWVCLNCGHIYRGATPPALCPVCKKPQAWFKLQVEDY